VSTIPRKVIVAIIITALMVLLFTVLI